MLFLLKVFDEPQNEYSQKIIGAWFGSRGFDWMNLIFYLSTGKKGRYKCNL